MSQVGPLIHGFGKGYYRSLLDWRRGCVYKSIQVKIPDDWKPVMHLQSSFWNNFLF